jgi:hypothetical protein
VLRRTALLLSALLSCAASALAQAPTPPTAQQKTVVQQPPVRSFQGTTDPYKEPPLSPFLPKPALNPDAILEDGATVTLPSASRQLLRFSPRYGVLPNGKMDILDKEKDIRRAISTGGLIVNVVYLSGSTGAETTQEVEFAADNVVVWMTGGNKQEDKLQNGLNDTLEGGDKTQFELYLQGNVVIRTINVDPNGQRTIEEVLRADSIYYDLSQNRAIAQDADLELNVQGFPEKFHLKGEEMWQLGPNEFKAFNSEFFSSRRPADPGVKATARESTLLRRKGVRRNIFGLPYRDLLTGKIDDSTEQLMTNEKVRYRIGTFPIWGWPKSTTDLNEPLGPLAGLRGGNDQILGFQAYATWDLNKLLALRGPKGHSWYLYTDYLSLRGVALGTRYDYRGTDFLGFGNSHDGFLRLYGINDRGTDLLGGDRPTYEAPPEYRGRIQWRHNQDLYENNLTYLRVMAQVEYLSDPNFLEQYYKLENDFMPNQETFAYLYGASGNLYGSLLTQANLERRWVTETEWKPRVDGAMIGQSFLNFFSYSARGSAGYANLLPADVGAPVAAANEQRVDTGRFQLNQRLSAPFDLGPMRLDPYGVVDLAHYTQDLTGEARGRFYGGGGVKSSVTMSKLYENATSELFNLNGLNHKVTFGANYFAAYSDTPHTQLPLLDRLTDDATDLAYRNSRFAFGRSAAGVPLISKEADSAIASSPIFDQQKYAIRKLTDGKADTLDSLEVLQLDLRQRLQTKRGFPGTEHTVDWLTLDLSMSVFPNRQRDNFGETAALFEYFTLWHIGDRFSVSSSGWYDPFDQGARYFNVGFNFNRPDGSTFIFMYRHMDPVNSRAVTAIVNYQLSRKYSVVGTATYDFGSNLAITNSLSFARTGTDMTVLFGVTYNALVQNFGLQFALVPNLAGLSGLGLANGPVFGGAQR